MRPIALDIPDDPAALAGWLDRHVAGLDLADLVAELEVAHGPAPAVNKTLEDLVGDRRGAVLAGGLAALPADRLRQLLRRPRLLLNLQELILLEGGAFWRRLKPEAEHLAMIERGRARLEAIGGKASRPETVAWYRRRSVVTLAMAASLVALVVGYGWEWAPVQVAQAPAGWGWARPGALPQDVPPAAYLDRLADDAGEWFKQRPDKPVALARRLGEFRAGCSVLILAEHRPLSAEDRTWLVEKCRAWAGKIDRHLADVEAGIEPSTVRDQADETVNALIKALRTRGRQVSRAEAA